jgi:hypothetical protein
MTKKPLSEVKRINLINAIQDCLENNESCSGRPLNDWQQGFLEDMSKRLSNKQDLIGNQYPALTKIIGFDFLK